MPPAARVGDNAVNPADAHGCLSCPHPGGLRNMRRSWCAAATAAAMHLCVACQQPDATAGGASSGHAGTSTARPAESTKAHAGATAAGTPAASPKLAGADPLRDFPSPTPGLLKISPPVPRAGHVPIAGWSGDGSEFGFCGKDGSRAPAVWCEFLRRDGSADLIDGDSAKAAPDLLGTERARGFYTDAVTWAYASDLVITWRMVPAETDDFGPGTLKVGARVLDAKSPAYVVSLREVDSGSEIHPEAITLSPDGSLLGVLGHAPTPEGVKFLLAVVSVQVVASRAYSAAAFAWHKKKTYETAALLFKKAHAADPTWELAAYNLACALARLHDPAAEIALRRAVALGGAATKKKAATDADLAELRGEVWFRELTR